MGWAPHSVLGGPDAPSGSTVFRVHCVPTCLWPFQHLYVFSCSCEFVYHVCVCSNHIEASRDINAHTHRRTCIHLQIKMYAGEPNYIYIYVLHIFMCMCICVRICICYTPYTGKQTHTHTNKHTIKHTQTNKQAHP